MNIQLPHPIELAEAIVSEYDPEQITDLLRALGQELEIVANDIEDHDNMMAVRVTSNTLMDAAAAHETLHITLFPSAKSDPSTEERNNASRNNNTAES